MLEKIFDTKNCDGEIQLKFNQTKCIDWLAKKCNALETHLKSVNVTQNTKAVVTEQTEEKLKLEAYELMCQYLDKALNEPLRRELKLSSPLDTNDNNKIKRVKQEVKEEVIV